MISSVSRSVHSSPIPLMNKYLLKVLRCQALCHVLSIQKTQQNTVPAGTELSLLGKDVQAVGFHCDKSNDVGSKNDDT